MLQNNNEHVPFLQDIISYNILKVFFKLLIFWNYFEKDWEMNTLLASYLSTYLVMLDEMVLSVFNISYIIFNGGLFHTM